MLEIIISGGQTGADVAGWRAAKRCGLVTRGWMPANYLTEVGPRPEYAAEFGAQELVGGGYPQRTRRNVQDADAVLWFGSTWSAGAKVTLNAAHHLAKPAFIVGDLAEVTPEHVAGWINNIGPPTLMVAGNRASGSTMTEQEIEDFLVAVFVELGYTDAQPG